MLVLAGTVLGAVLAAAHPDPTAGDRFYALSWLAVAIGAPVAAAAHLKTLSDPMWMVMEQGDSRCDPS